IVVCFDKLKQSISYAAAHNTPVIVRNKQIIELSADKMPVGQGIRTESFTLHRPDLQKNDMLYLYTDGYADQFGGPHGKKFKYKTLNNLLAELSEKPLDEQKQALDKVFDDWKAGLEQVDDVCIMGIRI
ncbi:MAG: PP2C family protein-serine/threonine phosphatase, partial [Bacteroidia bacterium]